MWYALPVPPICSRNQSRCWAKESGSRPVRSAGSMDGSSVRAAFSMARARSASTGERNSSTSGTSTPSTCRTREITRTASSEWPPSSKKPSLRPIRSTPSTSDQISASACSVSLAGASWPPRAYASPSGAGSAPRSSFPFAVSGRLSRRTYAAGTMCSGSRSASDARSASASTESAPTR